MNTAAIDQTSLKQHRYKHYIGLMDLYEQNYIKLRCLIPDMHMADVMISQVAGYSDLHLSVKERCKYTTIINLTYQFKKQKALVFQPNLTIRIYHDAKTAEVQNSCNRSHQINSKRGSLEHQWQLNRFLYKWLSYCLHQGHQFVSIKTC